MFKLILILVCDRSCERSSTKFDYEACWYPHVLGPLSSTQHWHRYAKYYEQSWTKHHIDARHHLHELVDRQETSPTSFRQTKSLHLSTSRLLESHTTMGQASKSGQGQSYPTDAVTIRQVVTGSNKHIQSNVSGSERDNMERAWL